MNNKNNVLIVFISIFLIITTIFSREISARRVIFQKTKPAKIDTSNSKTETNTSQFIPVKIKPIKIGILRSKSEKLSSTEESVINATLLAIDEINEQGGILKRKIELIIVELENDLSIIAEILSFVKP